MRFFKNNMQPIVKIDLLRNRRVPADNRA